MFPNCTEPWATAQAAFSKASGRTLAVRACSRFRKSRKSQLLWTQNQNSEVCPKNLPNFIDISGVLDRKRHPDGKHFVMAGRLFQGTWNLALFDAATGRNLFSIDAKHRITDARFSADGQRLFLAKARQQELKNGRWNDFGLLEIHTVSGLGA